MKGMVDMSKRSPDGAAWAYDIGERYTDPFALLPAEAAIGPETSRTALSQAIQQALKQFDLYPSSELTLDGRKIHKSVAKPLLEALLDDTKRSAYWVIHTSPTLRAFLVSGDGAFFTERQEEQRLPKDEIFLSVLKPHFCAAFSHAFHSALMQAHILSICRLGGSSLSRHPLLADDCFAKSHAMLVDTVLKPVQAHAEPDKMRSVFANPTPHVAQLVNADLWNALPPFFEPLRNDLGSALNDLYCTISNPAHSLGIIRIAHALILDGEVRRIVDLNMKGRLETEQSSSSFMAILALVYVACIAVVFLAAQTSASSQNHTPRYAVEWEYADGRRVSLLKSAEISKLLEKGMTLEQVVSQNGFLFMEPSMAKRKLVVRDRKNPDEHVMP